MSERWRLYEVTVSIGERDSTTLYSATSRSKAMAEAWRDYSDAWDISFRKFLNVARVQAYRGAAPTDCYAYIRRAYGLSVTPGDRVVLKHEGDLSGREGEIVYPGASSLAYVHVVLDGERHKSLVHPRSITVLPSSLEAIGDG